MTLYRYVYVLIFQSNDVTALERPEMFGKFYFLAPKLGYF